MKLSTQSHQFVKAQSALNTSPSQVIYSSKQSSTNHLFTFRDRARRATNCKPR